MSGIFFLKDLCLCESAVWIVVLWSESAVWIVVLCSDRSDRGISRQTRDRRANVLSIRLSRGSRAKTHSLVELEHA